MNGVEIVLILVNILFWLVLARVIMSWIPVFTNRPLDYGNPLVKFLIDVTEPLLAPIRRFATLGMMDLSPMVLLFALIIIQSILVRSA